MSVRWTEADVMAHNARLNRLGPRHDKSLIDEQAASKRSKYRNVKTQVDGLMFDSRREADYWLQLRARQDLGEIRELRRQVDFPLLCPVAGSSGVNAQVSVYRADFVFVDTRDGSTHVVDAKGHKTREYLLKRKWLELQANIRIEEA